MITEVNSRILANSPYLWFWKFFTKIGKFYKNPGIQLLYLGFSLKNVKFRLKVRFWNFSKSSLSFFDWIICLSFNDVTFHIRSRFVFFKLVDQRWYQFQINFVINFAFVFFLKIWQYHVNVGWIPRNFKTSNFKTKLSFLRENDKNDN